MAATEQDIVAALRTVIDPDVHKDLVTLNQVKSIKVVEENVAIEINTPSPLKDRLRQQVTAADQYEAGSGGTARTVTLAVTEEQAREILRAVGTSGQPVTLLLCPPGTQAATMEK